MIGRQKVSEIIHIADNVDVTVQGKAEDYHQEVLNRTMVTTGHLIELGRLFKTIRDEKLYRMLGAETFQEYCAFPEIHYARTTIYSFIGIYELYCLKYGYSPKLLVEIGHHALQLIKPIMKVEDTDNTTEWMHKAKTLSESDLINEIRKYQGKPEMMPKPKEEKDVYPFSFTEYMDFVKAHPCITCDEEESDPAHFPRSKGAGGKDTHRIPLCRGCHALFHQDPFDFLWLHKDKIFDYFFDMFLKSFALWKILGGK